MRSKNPTTILMMALVVIMALALPAFSEEKSGDNMQPLIEKMRDDTRLFLEKKMVFTESEAKAFWPSYESYEVGVSDLMDRLIKGIKSYAKFYDDMSDKQAKSLRTEYLTIKLEELRLLQSYLLKLEKILPEKKVFRFFQLERTFQGELEALLGEVIPLIRYNGDDNQGGKK